MVPKLYGGITARDKGIVLRFDGIPEGTGSLVEIAGPYPDVPALRLSDRLPEDEMPRRIQPLAGAECAPQEFLVVLPDDPLEPGIYLLQVQSKADPTTASDVVAIQLQ